ncbi:Sec-independent protein translocase protein TatB [Chloroflexota bacterium]
MGFFDMGIGEILLVIVVALIIWGPGKMPEIARTVGKTISTLRKTSYELTAQVRKELELEETGSPSQPKKEGTESGEFQVTRTPEDSEPQEANAPEDGKSQEASVPEDGKSQEASAPEDEEPQEAIPSDPGKSPEESPSEDGNADQTSQKDK